VTRHAEHDSDLAVRLRRWVTVVVGIAMAVDLVVTAFEGQWLNAFLLLVIMFLILAPVLLGERLPVHIPAEFQLLALLFSFAALFLGEARSYYYRFWWWDIMLHVSSGLLLGILGFLLVYALNENRRARLNMRPRFIALFAFNFAVGVGALWEVFEFAMDRLFGLTMQKPMLGDTSGLTDTMWDLIVDTLGALVISVLGWWYMHRGNESFIEVWIKKFIAANPRLFRRR
jgi:uncharacterized membrane protein YjdF